MRGAPSSTDEDQRIAAELELRRRRAHARARSISLAEFVREAWPIVEPGTELVWGWHIDAICLHLEAVTDGRIKRLLINIPPGHMKSLLVSVMWPAWMWLKRPGERMLTGSYDGTLALRDSVKTRDLITSDWYQRTFRPGWSLKRDQNVKSRYANTTTGERMCFAVGGKLTGFRGHGWIVDDPLNMKDALSETAREEAKRIVCQALPTRLNNQETGWRVIVMQRLHEEDPSGVLLQQGGWEHLCLPARFDPERRSSTCIGWTDPRTEKDELLFSAMFSDAVLAQLKLDLGPQEYEGQFEQRPTPAGGLIFERSWWKYYDTPPAQFDELAISVDATFKDLKSSDYVTMGVWGRTGQHFYLLDMVRDKMDYPTAKDALRALCARWPTVSTKLIEDKANGSALIAELGREIGGMIAISPTDSKVARARAISGHAQAGCIWLPRYAPWLEAFILECARFPLGKHDDQVDNMTQAILFWLKGKRAWWM